MSQKRERSTNFSREEMDFLIKIIEENKHIIENKKSDAVTWKEKEQCWKKIETAFNSAMGVTFRSAKTLKLKYDGIKKNTRQKSAAIRAEAYKTGGGPSKAPVLTPAEEKVKTMILLSVQGMPSNCDSDYVVETAVSTKPAPMPPIPHMKESNDFIINYSDDENVAQNRSQSVEDSTVDNDRIVAVDEETMHETPVRNLKRNNLCENLEDVEEPSTSKKWSQWKPKDLRSKKHPALCKSKPKRPFEKLAESKLDIANLQKQILEEEIENKRLQWKFEGKEREEQQKRWDFEEEERQHKRLMWALEKEKFEKNAL